MSHADQIIPEVHQSEDSKWFNNFSKSGYVKGINKDKGITRYIIWTIGTWELREDKSVFWETKNNECHRVLQMWCHNKDNCFKILVVNG